MKKWYQSKTVWVNVISILLEILNLLMDNPIIPVKYAGVFTMLVNALNLILRFITTSAINMGGGKYVVNEVTSLPDVGVQGQWYHLPNGGSTYWYYADEQWNSVDNSNIGGGTVGTPK